MKVSSLTKEETLYLLNLYKELHKVEEELDIYISNTAAPEVSNIKKNRESIKQSSEEATEILNSEIKSKDTLKMINLLEEYIESSEEIENAREKTEQIMYVIEELLDKKNDIEDEIKSLESKVIIERKYDSKEVINSSKNKIISSEKNLIDRIISELNNNVTYLLTPKNNNVTDELIKIVDEHISDKKKFEEEQLKIVENQSNVEFNENQEKNAQPVENNIETIVDQPVVSDTPVENENTQKVENNVETIIDQPTISQTPVENVINLAVDNNVNAQPSVDTNLVQDNNVEVNTQDNNIIPLSDVLNRVLYVDTDIQDKKVAKIPPQKRDTVFETWNGYTSPVEFKTIESLNNTQLEEKNNDNVVPNNFNIENFAQNKAA